MKRIAVLTSGGDASGMNAAIRAVVRAAAAKNWEVFGILHGFSGLMHGTMKPLGVRDVGGIIQAGGTVLGSARPPEFETPEGRQRGIRVLTDNNIDALIVIGGNGTQKGSFALSNAGVSVVGIASTIDNDLYGSEITIGSDTALNIAIESIDRLKVTASSHNRIFIVEVMGRDCGYLALMAGIAGGAEAIVIPEIETDIRRLTDDLHDAYVKGKSHAIVVVAEGARYNAVKLRDHFTSLARSPGFEVRTTSLGYVQRGGTPTFFDRVLATRLGAAAVDVLANGMHGVVMGLVKSDIVPIPLADAARNVKTLNLELMGLAEVLAR